MRDADARLVADWAGKLVADLAAASPRWSIDKKGAPAAEPLFAEVHAARIEALKREGKAGKGLIAEAQKAFEAGKPDPVAAPAGKK